ncbi:MAG: hemerythrin domain-containing protein [Oceanospirillaceae bacterium]|nr:hemerythrin domain-containing protein [Oceanospirillaceae bacterium]
MFDQTLLRQAPLPDEMRILLDKYPREAWDEHPNFKQATKNWLSAHQMFRALSSSVRKDAELYLDRQLKPGDYAARLSYRGNALVGNLHGHHHWEDNSYFPELSAADPRFDIGLKILESDHRVLNRVLNDFTEAAMRTLEYLHLSKEAALIEAGNVHSMALTIEKLLARHLVDEEELAVPIIIHHKLRD